jgi:hypothetical protein
MKNREAIVARRHIHDKKWALGCTSTKSCYQQPIITVQRIGSCAAMGATKAFLNILQSMTAGDPWICLVYGHSSGFDLPFLEYISDEE